MTKARAIQALRTLRGEIFFQSTNPYNHSTKEKHVRDLLADYAHRLDEIGDALVAPPKRGVRSGR